MDWKGKLEKKLNKLKSISTIPAENKEYLDKMVRYLNARNLNPQTVLRWLDCIDVFFIQLGNKNLATATKEDLEDTVARINMLEYKEETKAKIKIIIKAFYKHFFGEDLYYPKQIAWIKTSVNRNKKYLPEDMLSEEEIMRLIKMASNPRDKAIIALLYDSGIRAGELLNLRVKDIDLSSNPAHIVVNGKTGPRQIPILFSVPYLASFLNSNSLNSTEYLWWNMAQSHMKGRLNNAGLAVMLVRLSKESKINKHVHPHLFRHSRATYYANQLSDQQLKAYFGWVGDSKMASTYVHLSGKNIDSAVMRANGIEVEESINKPKLSVKICPKCRYTNGVDMSYCGRCGGALDIQTALNQEIKVDSIWNFIKDAYKDPEERKKVVEDVVHQHLLDERKRKR